MRSIDINCDMGEGEHKKNRKIDMALMDIVSSINIACGFHAGSPEIMKQTTYYALKKNLAIGAHPGFNDKEGFGRRKIHTTPDHVYNMIIYQTGALQGFVTALGGQLHHVKPHGALYNMAANNAELAQAIAEAVYDLSPDLILYGQAGSHLISEGKKACLRTASEAFADRTYKSDVLLTPRTQANASIIDINKAIDQVLSIIQAHQVTTVDNKVISIEADTLCIHGDHPQALPFAKQIAQRLKENYILIEPQPS